jgi:hypothetical protein
MHLGNEVWQKGRGFFRIPKIKFAVNLENREMTVPKDEDKSKVKCDPATRHGGAWGERRYSSYSYLTSVLDGCE